MNVMGYISSDFLSAGRSSVVSRSVGTFIFDAVTAEGHDSTMRVTNNPIESGSVVSDHAVIEPKEITISGIMVGYQPPNPLSDIVGYSPSSIDRLPLPMSISAVTKQSLSLLNRYISLADEVVKSSSRIITTFLPDYNDSAKDKSDTLDRVGKAYRDLEIIQRKGEVIDVQTGIKLYKNMMLIKVGVMQSQDNSAEFTLTLREIHIVNTKKANGLKVDVVNHGKTQAAESSQSALKGMFS